MSFGHALYYPHINLTNKNWLKHAMLFWDRISRIVPYRLDPQDDEDIIRIKETTDFIQDYHPESWDTSDTFHRFSKIIEHLIHSDNFFYERYRNSEHRQFRRHYDDFRHRNRFYSEMVKSKGTYLHIQKIDERLKEMLFEYGLAIPGENQWEDWVKIDNEIGLLYMSYFAKSISKKKSLPIVTDVEEAYSASINYESNIWSDNKAEFEYRLGNLLIETSIPKNVNDVSVDKILKIRDKYKSERAAFFIEISRLSDSLSNVDNHEAMEDALNLYSNSIKKEVENLEKLFKSFKVETVNKFLSISIPSSVVSLIESVPTETKPLVIAGGIIFGIFSAANTIKKDKLELNKNPKSYLLNIKSETSGDNIFRRINDLISGMRKW